jgi:hypothetical protein
MNTSGERVQFNKKLLVCRLTLRVSEIVRKFFFQFEVMVCNSSPGTPFSSSSLFSSSNPGERSDGVLE